MDEGGSCPQKKWMGVEKEWLKTKDINRYGQIKNG